MRVGIGSDHAGFELIEQIAGIVRELGHEVVDVGTYSTDEKGIGVDRLSRSKRR